MFFAIWEPPPVHRIPQASVYVVAEAVAASYTKRMKGTTPTLEKVQAAVGMACAKFPVRRVEVFGSLVHGGAGADSDVDLLVEFLPGAAVGLFEMGALKEDIEELLGCAVDLVSRKAVENSANSCRRKAILADPVTVYAR